MGLDVWSLAVYLDVSSLAVYLVFGRDFRLIALEAAVGIYVLFWRRLLRDWCNRSVTQGVSPNVWRSRCAWRKLR